VREIRIYQPGDYRAGETIELTEEAGQHVGVVLRLQPGAKLTLFRGDNHEFEAVISSVHKKHVFVTLLTSTAVNRESSRVIHLAQAISKGDRMETVVQKAVELGVASITPLITQHCALKLDEARMEKKRLQWQAIAIAACEQSGRNTVPAVNPVLSLVHYLQKKPAALNFVLYPEAKKSWRDYGFNEQEIGLIIGPEGGLSPDEIQLLFTHHFLPLSLGPRVLRTETAAIVALSVLQAVCGDL
jgi:16S rRNA (uracil1498-N3)-methyltransferase